MNDEKNDKIITHFLESLDEWKNYVIIGGGYAPIIYRLYFTNYESSNPPVGTQDIDSLIPRRLPQVSENNLASHLKKAGFVQVYKDRENPPTESYTKVIDGEQIEVEFLTDDSVRNNKHLNVEISGVVAQPLTYLKMSLLKNIYFKTFNGTEGVVVSPEAWVFHKGLTFVKRSSKGKELKDLYGIWYVLSELGHFSQQAIHSIPELGIQNESWYRTLRKNVNGWIEKATPVDWRNLEFQDPSGRLKKESFIKLVGTVFQ